MEDRRAIGRRIREAREELGWTQQQLGERYGVSHAAISDIERGVTKLGITELRRLADILGKDLTFFLRGTNFQLRHEPGARPGMRKLKEDFIRYVRSLEKRDKEDRTDDV